MRIVIAVAIVVVTTACGPKCPKCPLPPPPEIIEVKKPCMDPFPIGLEPPVFPKPRPDEVVELPKTTLTALVVYLGVIRGYIDTQLTRCTK